MIIPFPKSSCPITGTDVKLPCPDFVKKSSTPSQLSLDEILCLVLPLQWLLTPKVGSLSERILSRVAVAEQRETDRSYQADIRIAWLIVLYCWRGDAVECDPLTLATYNTLGCHPSEVWLRICERRQALLGQFCWPGALSRKKPCGSVRDPRAGKKAA